MLSSIFENIWNSSPRLNESDGYAALLEHTETLIKIYDEEGRLYENPFTPTAKRRLSLPEAKLRALLKDSVCVVTGGMGCVGRTLVGQLLKFEIKRIVIIDKSIEGASEIESERVTCVKADVCDQQRLLEIFALYKPRHVFHTAAQRDPGYAEKHISETVEANVLGTAAVVQACEQADSVERFVFSSTGKASRYYTDEVYAATKKICEYIIDSMARKSSKMYSMVRFTHILENSLMNTELQNIQNEDHVRIHSPGKYVTAQNVLEAANLMLNALAEAQVGKCNFLIVRNLEWPVESLEVALYYIKQRKDIVPIVFKGNPPGYCEKFFRGQLDWSNPHELNLLINVYECKSKYTNEEEDIIISSIVPTDVAILAQAIGNIRNSLKDDSSVNKNDTVKNCLLGGLVNLVKASLVNVDKQVTIDILKWGLQPEYLSHEGTTLHDYSGVTGLLVESLDSAEFLDQVKDIIGETRFNKSDFEIANLYIGEAQKQQMIDIAKKSYPEECCGFLFGRKTDEETVVTNIMAVDNVTKLDKSCCFEISTKDYLKAEKYAEDTNASLVGVYHSHPDHDGRPSSTDTKFAIPNLSYIIISLTPNSLTDIKCWQLNDTFTFLEQLIKL